MIVALLTITAAACGDDSDNAAAPNPGGPAVGELPSQDECPPPNIATIDPSILKVEAAPVAPLVHDQPASFKVTLTNTSDTDVPLVFASSQQADILLSQDGKQVYDWSANRALHAGDQVPDPAGRSDVHGASSRRRTRSRCRRATTRSRRARSPRPIRLTSRCR